VDDPRARVARLPAPEGLAVVFEDEVLIAVNKPSGLLSQPGRQVEDSVVVRVRAARPDASGSLLVHRLDMDTSGVLLLAKTPEAHAALQQQFEKRQVQKRYRALIDGDVSGAGGLINLPLRLDVDRRPYQIVCPDHGRAAVTAWKLVRRSAGQSEIVMYPQTGRTHQLRVHASDERGLGFPVVGDRLYGLEGDRLCLHAEKLVINHPQHGGRVKLESPSPFAL
jgi:tRNA pseudouridine32 synthase/23S rRNA pseudouridine746 synthase